MVTPNSIVRMIVSATTDGGNAVASGTGHLGGVVVECQQPASSPTEAPPHRNDTDPERGYPPTTRALSFTKSPFDHCLASPTPREAHRENNNRVILSKRYWG